MKFDPYETLGVERDATDAEIKRAAKEKAKKSHPDKGGNAEEFQASRRAARDLDRSGKAEALRSNRRCRRCETGQRRSASDGSDPHHELAEITNAYLMSNFDSAKDPRQIDLLAKVEASIMDHIRKGEEMLRQGGQHARFLRDFRSRFTKKATKGGKPNANRRAFDFIARKLDDEIIAVEAKSEQLKETVAGARLSPLEVDSNVRLPLRSAGARADLRPLCRWWISCAYNSRSRSCLSAKKLAPEQYCIQCHRLPQRRVAYLRTARRKRHDLMQAKDSNHVFESFHQKSSFSIVEAIDRSDRDEVGMGMRSGRLQRRDDGRILGTRSIATSRSLQRSR